MFTERTIAKRVFLTVLMAWSGIFFLSLDSLAASPSGNPAALPSNLTASPSKTSAVLPSGLTTSPSKASAVLPSGFTTSPSGDPSAVSQSGTDSRKVAGIRPSGDGFVIAYADGTLCFTDIEGTPTDSLKLKRDIECIEVTAEGVIAVSTDRHVTLAQSDGKSRTLCRNLPGNGSVAGIANYNGTIYILSVYGTLLSTADWNSFRTFDFNSTYSGYYEFVTFSDICASDNAIFIAGSYDSGIPAVFTSAQGNIWSERGLTYTEGPQTLGLDLEPVALAYDALADRFVMACTGGCLFFMPGCSHCNSIEQVQAQDLQAVAFNRGQRLFR